MLVCSNYFFNENFVSLAVTSAQTITEAGLCLLKTVLCSTGIEFEFCVHTRSFWMLWMACTLKSFSLVYRTAGCVTQKNHIHEHLCFVKPFLLCTVTRDRSSRFVIMYDFIWISFSAVSALVNDFPVSFEPFF